jgi:hypothetical protein
MNRELRMIEGVERRKAAILAVYPILSNKLLLPAHLRGLLRGIAPDHHFRDPVNNLFLSVISMVS